MVTLLLSLFFSFASASECKFPELVTCTHKTAEGLAISLAAIRAEEVCPRAGSAVTYDALFIYTSPQTDFQMENIDLLAARFEGEFLELHSPPESAWALRLRTRGKETEGLLFITGPDHEFRFEPIQKCAFEGE